MGQPTLTVLYITGWCRNGSTLIGNILNEIDGFFHAGELFYLWKNVSSQGTNTSCGCGQPLASCPIWSRVLAEVGGGDPRHVREVMAQQPAVRTRNTWRVLRSQGRGDPRLAAYAAVMARTYRALQQHTGARVIVDGGKYPAEAALLGTLPGIRPVYLHLVRDPRASASSWSQSKAYIPAMSASRSTAYWVGFNLASEALRRRYPERSLFLRYEDFISSPEQQIGRIITALGVDARQNPLRGRAASLGVNHTVTGNPDRFVSGEVTVRAADVDWRARLPRRAALTATLLALPLLRRYGY